MLSVQATSSESFIDVLMFSGQGALLGRLGGDMVLGKDPITDRLGDHCLPVAYWSPRLCKFKSEK